MQRRSVITSPIPTLDEFGERLGLSKARRKAIVKIVERTRASGALAARARGSRNGIPRAVRTSNKSEKS